jgi:hypothetical protein
MTPLWNECDKKWPNAIWFKVIGWIRIFPPLGFKCSSNFRTFVQMFVAHLGNVCQCKPGCKLPMLYNVLVTQFRCKIAIKSLSKLDALIHMCCIAPYSLKGLQFKSQMKIISIHRQQLYMQFPTVENAISTGIFKSIGLYLAICYHNETRN